MVFNSSIQKATPIRESSRFAFINEVHKFINASLISSIGLLLIAFTDASSAQNVSDIERDSREQRRAQERQIQRSAQQSQTPEVRLGTPTEEKAKLSRDETPCFLIREITLQGKNADAFSWILENLAGPKNDDSPLNQCLGTKSIDTVLQRGQAAVVDRGFVTTRVLAQPQDLSSGTLALTVIVGLIETIRFESDATQPPPTLISTAVPIQAGAVLNLRDIEQSLENFKRVPSAEADIQIKPASAPDRSDLVISYLAKTPWRISASLDDSGSKYTGRYQASLTASWDNPLGLNDLFYITQSHDAAGGDPGSRGTQGSTLAYSMPLGYWLFGSTWSRSRYFQTVAGLNQDYVYSGTSENTEVKFSRLVYRDTNHKSTLSLKGWQRKSNNFIDDTEVQVQRRIVGGWEFGLNHKSMFGGSTVEGNLVFKRGTKDFDSIAAPEEIFNEGTSLLGLIALDLNASHDFKIATQHFKYNAAFKIQDNATPLTPQDRFSIGGRYSVRGFDGESALTGERGWTLRNDWSMALGGSVHEMYLGLDAGEVSGPSSQNLLGKSLSGGVIGIKGSFKGFSITYQYDVFVGAPLDKPAGFKTAETAAGFSLYASF